MQATILLVDDDLQILNMLKRALSYEGYEVLTAANGNEALFIVMQGIPDLVLLDIMMPQKDGWDVCQKIRKVDEQLPIIMLTAKDEIEDRIKGLDLGADDYVVKPFVLEELLARVRANIRRNTFAKEEKSRFVYLDLVINLDTHKAWRGKRMLDLKGKEFELLSMFLRHPEQVLSKDQLLNRIWGVDYEGESNVLEVYIASLRNKLEKNGEPRLIQTIRGLGYVLRGNSGVNSLANHPLV